VLWRGGGRAELPRASKSELATALVALIAERLRLNLGLSAVAGPAPASAGAAKA